MLYFEAVIFSSDKAKKVRILLACHFFLTKYGGKRTFQNAIKLSLQCIEEHKTKKAKRRHPLAF